MKKEILILAAIVLLAFGLRLFRLGEVPPSLHGDEPSWGYNAWSLLKTGRDEHGELFPIVFRAFGDDKLPVLVWAIALSEAVFGLNELAVRLPAALFGALSVILIYFFTRELFGTNSGVPTPGVKPRQWRGNPGLNPGPHPGGELKTPQVKGVPTPGFTENQKLRTNPFFSPLYPQSFALIASGLLALSPWHFHYSRGAWEANLLLTFILLGALFFLKSSRRSVFLWLSAFFFGASFYVYNSAKVLTPMILVGMIWLFRRQLRPLPAAAKLGAGVLFLLLAAPTLYLYLFGGVGSRIGSLGLAGAPPLDSPVPAGVSAEAIPSFWLFDNQLVASGRTFLSHYVNHFSGRFLVFEGDWANARHGVSFAGVANHFDLVLLLLGAVFLVRRRSSPSTRFLGYLLAVSPLPAALSRDPVHATRSYLMVLPLTIITAAGGVFLSGALRRLPCLVKFGLTGLFLAAYLASFTYFLDLYFLHAPIRDSAYWQYGQKQAVDYVLANQSDYTRIIFSQRDTLSYIYYLFYAGVDPAEYQQLYRLAVSRDPAANWVPQIGKIEFRNIFWPEDRLSGDTLLVGSPLEMPDEDLARDQAKIVHEITSMDGATVIRMVTTPENL